MLGDLEFQFDSGKHGARENAGNENPSEQARENHEEQIVAGVHRGEDQYEDRAEIDDPLARQLVIHLIHEPAQAGPPREAWDNRDGDPGGQPQSGQRRESGSPHAAFLGHCGGVQRENQSHR